MYDQSFSRKSLAREFQKRDFLGITGTPAQEQFREETLNKGVATASAGFSKLSNPLTSFPLKGKTVYMFPQLSNELVARKLCENIKRARKTLTPGRSQIVTNLRLLLEEGVPFRIYRLDIRSFYESFKPHDVVSTVDELPSLSPQSKRLLQEIFTCHLALGGQGVPRGLSLSAVLSDLMMQPFDQGMLSHEDVFFYSRYVDDIIVVTSTRESDRTFIRFVEKILPGGLTLNPLKKQIVETNGRVNPIEKPTDPAVPLFEFDYLGYSFHVAEPFKIPKKKSGEHCRSVVVDIARKKVTRFKTRISRAFFDFSKTGDWPLLKDRIKFLTKNFSVYNARAGGKKIAGIFHSYPLASSQADGLKALDNFLRNATLSNSGRICSLSSKKLTARQKRELLAQSFARGHAEASFVHFSGKRFEQIQACWKN